VEIANVLGQDLTFGQDLTLAVPLGRVPYQGCLSIGILAQMLVCAMPRLIEPDEITRPLSQVHILDVGWQEFHDLDEEPSSMDFAPPLLAAGRFTTVGRRGALPPLEWDD
jgi:hypothetical protein